MRTAIAHARNVQILVVLGILGIGCAHVPKLGIVDMQRALTDCREGRRARDELRQAFEERQHALDERQRSLQAEQARLAAAPTSTATQERTNALQVQLTALQAEFSTFQHELNDMEQTAIRRVTEGLRNALATIARARGIDLVLQGDPDGNQVAFHGDRVPDLTADVVQAYDASSGPAPTQSAAPTSTVAPQSGPQVTAPAAQR